MRPCPNLHLHLAEESVSEHITPIFYHWTRTPPRLHQIHGTLLGHLIFEPYFLSRFQSQFPAVISSLSAFSASLVCQHVHPNLPEVPHSEQLPFLTIFTKTFLMVLHFYVLLRPMLEMAAFGQELMCISPLDTCIGIVSARHCRRKTLNWRCQTVKWRGILFWKHQSHFHHL